METCLVPAVLVSVSFGCAAQAEPIGSVSGKVALSGEGKDGDSSDKSSLILPPL
jgi:hypothetical protein